MTAGRGRVAHHVAAFDEAVASGDWASFATRFAEDAVLDFVGVPAGPFVGRAAIAAAYDAQPPTDTMDLLGVETDGDVDVARFVWRAGGTGTMRFTWRDGTIARLVVAFDA
ncbi:nuclear transport factor 2 family protein [Nocardioides euryhalodurans]|uniref:Nuclear transport factor 2 family protein n=1 Tax=Nocardioides euryhalodurans TaxID=2518370 RepID=A0A4P7GJR7_9ACTN|nr:nuclear transport factor 2 family protein [Nocardioides euryhalodurans]QBR92019.1 nuclear transport factor 2 family protein [Nocardioides euryhalodurans]